MEEAMNIDTIYYASWENFKRDFINDIYGTAEAVLGKWLFRGQSSDTWELKTSFDRKYGSFPNKAAIERTMRDNFVELIKKSCLILNVDSYDVDTLSTVAQHYGMPTRLLDWSYSPYVAAFFAYANPAPLNETYVTVYALQRSHELWNGHLGCKIIEDLLQDNIHQKKQAGIFTLLNHTASSLEDYINSYTGADHSVPLVIMRIPKTERQKVIKDLKLMNITAETLFSGIESIAWAAESEAQMMLDIVQV